MVMTNNPQNTHTWRFLEPELRRWLRGLAQAEEKTVSEKLNEVVRQYKADWLEAHSNG